MVSTLFLTFCSTLGGCARIADANQYECASKRANEIIANAISEYVFDDQDSEDEVDFGFAKEQLLGFYEANNLIDDDYLEAMKQQVYGKNSVLGNYKNIAETINKPITQTTVGKFSKVQAATSFQGSSLLSGKASAVKYNFEDTSDVTVIDDDASLLALLDNEEVEFSKQYKANDIRLVDKSAVETFSGFSNALSAAELMNSYEANLDWAKPSLFDADVEESNLDKFLVDTGKTNFMTTQEATRVEGDLIHAYDERELWRDPNPSTYPGETAVTADPTKPVEETSSKYESHEMSPEAVAVTDNKPYVAPEVRETTPVVEEPKVQMEMLPKMACNTSNFSSSVAGRVGGCYFLGIIVSKDACVGFYNFLVDLFNGIAARVNGGEIIPGVIGILSAVVAAIKGGSAGTITTALTNFLKLFWKEYAALLTSGPLGIILAALIALVAALVIFIVVNMIVWGRKGSGFAVGWKIHNIFNWEWYYGAA